MGQVGEQVLEPLGSGCDMDDSNSSGGTICWDPSFVLVLVLATVGLVGQSQTHRWHGWVPLLVAAACLVGLTSDLTRSAQVPTVVYWVGQSSGPWTECSGNGVRVSPSQSDLPSGLPVMYTITGCGRQGQGDPQTTCKMLI